MENQTELALNGAQASDTHADADADTGAEREPSATPAMHAAQGEHAILDEFLSGADHGYMRPRSDKPHGLHDWLKSAGNKTAAAASLWLPPWTTAKAHKGLLRTATAPNPASAAALPILTSTATSDRQPTRQPGPRMALAATALAFTAVLIAAGALWVSAGRNAQLDELNTKLAQLRNAALHPVASETDLELLALRGRLDSLQAALNDTLEGQPQSIPALEQQQDERQQLLTRVAELEQIASLWEQQQTAAAQQAATPPPSVRPAAESEAPNSSSSVNTAAAADSAAMQGTTDKHSPAPASSPVATAAPASRPAERRTGPWVVNLLSVSSRAEAQREVKRLSKMDIQAEIQTAKVKQQTWYRIQVTGFASSSEAQDFGDRIAVQTGLKGAWAARK